MFGRSIRICKLFGISIELDLSWFVIFFLVAWSLSRGYFPYYYPGIAEQYYWIMGIVASLLLFLSVILHELSHSYVAIRNNLPISKITLFIFGGVANMTEEPKKPGVEFKVAIAGPICSLILMILFRLLATVAETGGVAYAVFDYLSWINKLLLLFNLIPGFPLDGGRLLRATLWHITGNVRMSTKIASNIGKGFALFLMTYGFLLMVLVKNPYGLWYILIGFFLQKAAASSYRQIVIKEYLSDLIVEKVMNKRVVSVEAGISLNELVDDYFLTYHFNAFPVVEGGKVVGVANIRDVKKLEREKWHATKVDEIMYTDLDSISISPSSGVQEAFNKMMVMNRGRLLVIDADGLIAGILSRSDIMHLLQVKSDLEG